MSRKFQVFISSTYNDLLIERQTAVQAVLDAGHIPAGMELFAAGDQAQLEVIKKWIDESDVLMLILGVRYGSIEPVSKLSYTHFEYQYALEKGKPLFALYMEESAFTTRSRELSDQIVSEDRLGYTKFRDLVKSKQSSPFKDPGAITIATFKTLKAFEQRDDLKSAGWVRWSDTREQPTAFEIGRLSAENAELRKRVSDLEAEKPQDESKAFSELHQLMRKNPIDVMIIEPDGHKISTHSTNLLQVFYIISIGMIDSGSPLYAQAIGTYLAIAFVPSEQYYSTPMARNWVTKIMIDFNVLDLMWTEESLWGLTERGTSFLGYLRRLSINAAAEQHDNVLRTRLQK